jgi:hypothetical protein
MKAVLDTITIHEDKPVVYIQIQDDAGKVVQAFSTYYKNKETFELEVNAKIADLTSRKQEIIASVQIEVLDVLSKISTAKEI